MPNIITDRQAGSWAGSRPATLIPVPVEKCSPRRAKGYERHEQLWTQTHMNFKQSAQTVRPLAPQLSQLEYNPPCFFLRTVNLVTAPLHSISTTTIRWTTQVGRHRLTCLEAVRFCLTYA